MNLILPRVTFIEDFRCYKVGDKVEFTQLLTIMTGDNGSGKSSLLSVIRKLFNTKWTMSDELQAENKIENIVPKDITIGYLDLSLDLYKGSAEMDFDNFNLYMQCMNSSSGEGVVMQLAHFLDTHASSPLIVIDEPEKGLSFRLQLIMTRLIRQHVKKHPNQQIIITTHSLPFMQLTEQIYSTTHRGYIKPNDYMRWMYESVGETYKE